jgi:hypothetical protein
MSSPAWRCDVQHKARALYLSRSPFYFSAVRPRAYLFVPRKSWNLWLLIASILFCAWGENSTRLPC